MSLKTMVDDSRTDKNTVHSYLDLYESLLFKKKETAENVLEVGIYNGGSIKLWYDYFKNANIYGLDIMNLENIWDELKNKNRIKLYTSQDAYNDLFVKSTFVDKDIRFDFVLDDGPHSLDSMIALIKLYLPIMKDDGILIIEDVQHYEWLEILTNNVPEDLKQYIQTYDLRSNKNRYDDIVFVINKTIDI